MKSIIAGIRKITQIVKNILKPKKPKLPSWVEDDYYDKIERS